MRKAIKSIRIKCPFKANKLSTLTFILVQTLLRPLNSFCHLKKYVF